MFVFGNDIMIIILDDSDESDSESTVRRGLDLYTKLFFIFQSGHGSILFLYSQRFQRSFDMTPKALDMNT